MWRALIASIALVGCTPVGAVGGPVDPSRLHDGAYQGSAMHLDNAKVTVTVKDHRVVDVKVDDIYSPFHKSAADVIPGRIVEKQSTNVDVVSGATEASDVIMNAAEDAVRKSYAAKPPP